MKILIILLLPFVISCVPTIEKTELIFDEDGQVNNKVNRTNGISLYNKHCLSCHGDINSTNKRSSSFEEIKLGLVSVSQMNNLLFLSNQEVRDIASALSIHEENSVDEDSNSGEEKDEVVVLPFSKENGQLLYQSNCMACHGSIENSSKLGSSSQAIHEAVKMIGKMSHLNTLSSGDIEEISLALDIDQEATFVAPQPEKMCKVDTTPGTNTKFLTPMLLRNTLIDLFGEDIVSSISVDLALLKLDTSEGEFSTFDKDLESILFKSYISMITNISTSVSKVVIEKTACLKGKVNKSQVTSSCHKDSISKWGLKVFRRPLSSVEVDKYTDLVSEIAADELETVYSKIFNIMLLSPEFLFLFEVSNNKASVYSLNDYEIATKLSYSLFQTTPSDQMLLDAKSGVFSDQTKLAAYVDTLLDDERAKRTIVSFAREWLHTENETAHTYTEDFLKSTIDKSNLVALNSEVQKEFDSFIAHLFLSKDTTFEDIFNSRWVDLKSLSNLAKVYGVDVEVKLLPEHKRSGVLTRAAMHFTGSNWKHPMKFGAQIRRNILCEDLPDPPDDAFDEIENKNEGLISTRKRLENAVAAPACMGCHKSINGLAFPFENIDSLARSISKESVYDVNAVYKGSVDVDSVTQPLIYFGDTRMVKNGVELSHLLSQAPKAKQCFSKKLSSFYLARMISVEDGCLVDDITNQINNKTPLREILKRVLLHKNFLMKKVK